jgi:2-polyprenyl-3-methyl-5-hydroxy-6-metoxy-1,4-benzoquinol methylase
MTGKIVLKITEDMDPKDVHCTTYQMRNTYQQVATAWINSTEVMSLSMHQAAAFMAKSGDKVLDVCCGRAMVLPLLRRHRPQILSYTGVDIWEPNTREALRWSAQSPIENKRLSPLQPGTEEPYYPFGVQFVHIDASEMSGPLQQAKLAPFDFIIYMASIEHMQKEAGLKSLVECYQLLRPNGRMFLTSPNTGTNEDTQYAAHLYEWDQEELLNVCTDLGFRLTGRWGLLAHARGYREAIESEYPELMPVFDKFSEYLPSAWLYAMFPILTPDIADEVGFTFTK